MLKKVYSEIAPVTLEILDERILRAFGSLSPEMLQNVLKKVIEQHEM